MTTSLFTDIQAVVSNGNLMTKYPAGVLEEEMDGGGGGV